MLGYFFPFCDSYLCFLFILLAEGLHVALNDATCGVFVSRCSNFHLFYTDDDLIVRHWARQNIKNLVSVLHCFYLGYVLRLIYRSIGCLVWV